VCEHDKTSDDVIETSPTIVTEKVPEKSEIFLDILGLKDMMDRYESAVG
jgi:hypothetical protein